MQVIMNDKKRQEAFLWLDQLSLLEKEELVRCYSQEYSLMVYEVALELVDLSESHKYDNISGETFAECIYDLREIKRLWSNNLGGMIIQSEFLAANKGNKDALIAIDEFIANCPSSFYRSVAEAQKSNLTCVGSAGIGQTHVKNSG